MTKNQQFKPGSPGRSPRPQAAGFTLLELLLAVVVATFVLVAINGVFFGALRLRARANAAVERGLELERALSILQRDLASIAPPGGTLSGKLQTSLTGVEGLSSGLNTLIQQGQIGPDFHTTSGVVDERTPWPEIQRVNYLLLDPTNRTAVGRDLVRAVTRNLLAPTVELPEYEPLLSGVEQLTFWFFDGSQWRQEWDSETEEKPLPDAIRVELQLAAEKRGVHLPPPIELIVPLLITPASNQVAQANSEGGAE